MKVQLTGKGVKLVIAAFVGITIYCLLKLQNETGSNSKKDVSSVDKSTADKINSKWGEWAEWGACSVTCGPGQKSRSRICVSNVEHAACEGLSHHFQDCHEKECGRGIPEMVASKITSKKVMMFSKTTCPFSAKAKHVFQKYLTDGSLSLTDYEIMELNTRDDGQQIQDHLLKLTGARTVPRVFINGKFVGGGDDIVAKEKSGELQELLGLSDRPKQPSFSCEHPPFTCVTIDTIKDGDGKSFPEKGDNVRVHYIGTFPDGKKFDSSRDRGEPFQFKLGTGQVIKGWDEGFQMLSLGQRAKLTISSDWAYGSRGMHVIPPNAMLIFDVELLSINSKSIEKNEPKQPAFCLKPPLTCVTIDTIKDGDGKTFPKKGDNVRLHYIGTLADGKKFDSSRDRGEPFQFTLGTGQVIKGYDEGFQMLSLGQRAKLTISPDWGYGSRGFPPVIPPNAVLIFDVEILSINSKSV